MSDENYKAAVRGVYSAHSALEQAIECLERAEDYPTRAEKLAALRQAYAKLDTVYLTI